VYKKVKLEVVIAMEVMICLLECDALYPDGKVPMFPRKLILTPLVGGSRFLRAVGIFLSGNTPPYSRRQYCSEKIETKKRGIQSSQ
jgi:hypothetical protein